MPESILVALQFVALAALFIGLPAWLQHRWRRMQAERAQRLVDVLDGDLPPVDVRTGTRTRTDRPGPADADRDRSVETWFAADLNEPATIQLCDPATCTAPHRLDDPRETTAIAVWGSEALAARVAAHEGLVRAVLGGDDGRRTVRDGTVRVVVSGEVDAMGRAAVISDLSDLVRALAPSS